jgi:4-hydroxybenzoate polyprenyltransferase
MPTVLRPKLVYRFWQYQKERFPLAVLVFTTLVTAGSSWVFSHASLRMAVLVFFTMLLYMFHSRGFDEVKDYEHDSLNYPERPLQRGLITRSELVLLTWGAIALEIIFNLSFNTQKGIIWYFVAFTYSLLTKKEFFIRDWLRNHFFLYNFLHLLQIGIFQIYVYATLAPIRQNVLVWHWLLVLLLVFLMEFARKMRAQEADYADDTYSAKLGSKWASVVYVLIFLISLLLVRQIIASSSLLILILPVAVTILGCMFAYHYAFYQNTKNSKMVQVSAFFFYLVCHLTIMLGMKI